MIDLAKLVARARELRPLPASVTRLAGLLAAPECELRDLVEVVELDAPLTGRLLGAANSAASGSRTPIRTVKEAIIRLGSGTVLALTLGAAVRETMRQALPAYGLDEDALWRHSVAAALATETLAGHGGLKVPPEAFAAALLHDVGKLVIGRHASELVGGELAAGALQHFENEVAVLQTHHAAIGGLVAQHWRLPPGIVKGILFHHEPVTGSDQICDVVCLADQLAHASGVAGPKRDFTEAERQSCARLGLDPERFERALAVLGERFQEVRARFD